MEKLSNLFGQRIKPLKKTTSTERGDLFDQILSRINPDRKRGGYKPLTHGRLAYLLTGIKTGDLYALLSKISDGERRGVAPGAVFWGEIRPRKDI